METIHIVFLIILVVVAVGILLAVRSMTGSVNTAIKYSVNRFVDNALDGGDAPELTPVAEAQLVEVEQMMDPEILADASKTGMSSEEIKRRITAARRLPAASRISEYRQILTDADIR